MHGCMGKGDEGPGAGPSPHTCVGPPSLAPSPAQPTLPTCSQPTRLPTRHRWWPPHRRCWPTAASWRRPACTRWPWLRAATRCPSWCCAASTSCPRCSLTTPVSDCFFFLLSCVSTGCCSRGGQQHAVVAMGLCAAARARPHVPPPHPALACSTLSLPTTSSHHSRQLQRFQRPSRRAAPQQRGGGPAARGARARAAPHAGGGRRQLARRPAARPAAALGAFGRGRGRPGGCQHPAVLPPC